MANGAAVLGFIAVIAAIGFNFSLHKIEEGRIAKLRMCSWEINGFFMVFASLISHVHGL